MARNKLKTIASRSRYLYKSFIDDVRGLAAVEFAYVAPLLFVTLFGIVEIGRAIQLDRKFDMVTSMMSDMVARQENFGDTPAERDAILLRMTDAIQHLMLPYDPSRLKLAVIPMARPIDEDESPFLYADPYIHNNYPFSLNQCSEYDGASTTSTGSDIDLINLVPPGGRVIVVRSQYDFDPIFLQPFQGGITGVGDFQFFTEANSTWEDFSVHSPRHNCNDFDNNNCQVSCS